MASLALSRRSASWLLVLPCVFFSVAGVAGDLSWNAAHTSPAINYSEKSVGVQYQPAPSIAANAAAHTIRRVHVSLAYPSGTVMQTRLCWNGTERCVPVTGSSFSTQAFNGLDAGKPIYLLHTAQGKGPLPVPVFVRGEVIVWFGS